MKRIIESFREIDRQQILIYSFSFLIYLWINKLSSNSILYLLGEDSFRERWTNFSIPCLRDIVPTSLVIAFEIFKCLLFLLMIILSKNRPKGIVSEMLIAYFLYDLVYILSFIWERIPSPIQLNSWWILSSSGQVFAARIIPYLDLILASIWTIILFIFLLRMNRLSAKFLITRLVIITISVPILYFFVYLISYRH